MPKINKLMNHMLCCRTNSPNAHAKPSVFKIPVYLWWILLVKYSYNATFRTVTNSLWHRTKTRITKHQKKQQKKRAMQIFTIIELHEKVNTLTFYTYRDTVDAMHTRFQYSHLFVLYIHWQHLHVDFGLMWCVVRLSPFLLNAT